MMEQSECLVKDTDQNNLNPSTSSETNFIVVSNVAVDDSSPNELKTTEHGTVEKSSTLSTLENAEIGSSDQHNVESTSTLVCSPNEESLADETVSKISVPSETAEKVSAQHISDEEKTDIAVGHSSAVEPNTKCVESSIRQERQIDPRVAPKIDCQEKIVFCIDASSDMNGPPFKLGNGGEFSPLSMVKRVVEIFVHSKQRISNKHEFGIMGFHDVAVWYKGFTSDAKEITDSLDEINEVKVCQGSGLSSVFTILSVIASELPSFNKPDVLPQFVLRVILIYGRSNCLPEKKDHIEMFKFLKSSPYFFLDVLYVHEVPSSENKCEEVFERLCDMDENETSYIFEVARNTTKLHNCMAKLIAHPLQRPLQKYTQYKLPDISIEC